MARGKMMKGHARHDRKGAQGKAHDSWNDNGIEEVFGNGFGVVRFMDKDR